MVNRILVPLDGSARAERVLPHVEKIGSALDARLHLLCAVGGSGPDHGLVPEDPLGFRLTSANQARYLDGRARGLRKKGFAVDTSVEAGGAAAAIVSQLRRRAYHLVALTPHGSGCAGHLQIGCTASAVMLNARSSVLMVPDPAVANSPSEGAIPDAPTIMVVVDHFTLRDWSIHLAARIACAWKLALDLVHVPARPEHECWFPTFGELDGLVRKIATENRSARLQRLDDVVAGLKGKGIEARGRLLAETADPAQALCDTVAWERPALVVFAAHPNNGSNQWISGRAAAKLLAFLRRPYLILQELQRPALMVPSGDRRGLPSRSGVQATRATVHSTN
jgi:nucleotide-binding universal stress UspA family protein